MLDFMRRFKFMKKNSILLLMVLLLSVAACSFTTKKIDPKGNQKETVLAELVTFVLETYHYSPKELNSEFSENVYKEYLKGLDPRKRFFLKEDIDKFEKHKSNITEELKNHNLDFFNLTYETLQKRLDEMQEVYKEILDEPFKMDTDEMINTDFENLDYPANKEARRELWRKQLKFNVISSYYDLKKEEKTKAEEEDGYEAKSDEELEKEARESTRHTLDQFYDINEDLTKEDWVSVFLNTIANQFDPHTGYYAPPDKDRFDIAMSGSLEGIGAQLQKDIENIKVTSLISGGPAWTDGRLKVGDLIQKVKQEDEEEAVSVVGMSINDAVKLIRGKKGTKVILTVKKVDGTTEEIDLIRDKVELEETYLKSAVTESSDKKYGVVKLPGFYFNMDDYRNERNAASDMKKEIELLKKENIDGLLIDLRDNGGGSLTTAIDIAGMFVDRGPVVQVKFANGKKEVLRHQNSKIEWEGPLVILVNELSASASEILAAAMQDYGRAVIIGSKQTYGKGTVQRFYDLNNLMRNNSLGDMGQVKLTTQKFYRINGGSTQLEGVHSDVVTPDRYSFMDVGERDLVVPLPYDEITPARYNKWTGYRNLDEVIRESQVRVDTSSIFDLIEENARWIKSERDKNDFPLSYIKYSEMIKEREDKADHFKNINEYKTDLSYQGLPAEMRKFETDTTLAKKRERWYKNLSKDAYVEEAIRVLQDLKLSDAQMKKMAGTR